MMGLIDRIYAFFNKKIIQQFNNFIVEYSKELDWWICNRYEPINIPVIYRNEFLQYNSDYKFFKSLGVTNVDFERYTYKQKEFIVKKRDAILSIYKVHKYIKHVVENSNRLCYNNPLVIQYYIEKEKAIRLNIESLSQIIKKGKYGASVCYLDIRPSKDFHTTITSLYNLPFEIKEEICKLDNTRIFNIQKEIENLEDNILRQKEAAIVQGKFSKEILDNKRRKQHYQLFLKEKKIECKAEEYCIGHLDDLDDFIATMLKLQYDELKRLYPEGISYYDAINNCIEGDHLSGIDYWEDCVKASSLIKQQHHIALEYNKLYALYPNGIEEYQNCHRKYDDNFGCFFFPSKNEIVGLGIEKIKEYERLSKIIKRDKTWVSEQRDFASKCRIYRDDIINNWGCYVYDLLIETPSLKKSTSQLEYRVWQLFCKSYCTDETIDYTYYPDVNEQYKNILPSLREMTVYFKNRAYDKIIDYISLIKSKYGNILVLFGDSGMNSKRINDYHFKYLKRKLEERSIFFGSNLINKQYPFLYKYVIVVELISTNEHLKEQCLEIINNFKDQCPHIVFISLEKEFDTQEMLSLIDSAKLRKEEEIKEAQRIENKRKEEINGLLHCVAGWYEPSMSCVKCFSMYYYYPTTCDWEADEGEWWIRNLIWNFKANPNKPQPLSLTMELHKKASNTIVEKLVKCLKYFFGDMVSKLTFVCIPSSKAIITKRRYEDFSEQICNVLKMANAYPYIHVEQDGEAKHIGGTLQAKYIFDESFFKGRYVILFDDVITSGRSMEKFKNRMERMGAFVIGGISIGKTKHERQSINPIERLDNYKHSYYDNLPF